MANRPFGLLGRPGRTLRSAVLRRDKHTCRHCGFKSSVHHATRSLEIDHIRPLTYGGLTQYGNLQTLCAPCNRRKGVAVPTRDIKESCRTSDTLAQLSHGAERLFWRLTTYADDFGRMPADVRVVRAACFPLMLQKVKEADVQSWLDELVRTDLIRLYSDADKKSYAFFVTWAKHQRTRAKTSKYPAPSSADICRHMPADVADKAVTTEDTEVPPKTPTVGNPSPRAEEAGWGRPEDLVKLYNTQAPDNVPAVEELSEKRRDKCLRALRQYPRESWWREVFVQYRRSKFLRGAVPAREGHSSFRPDFDWLLSTGKNGTENYVKVHDGMYAD